MTIKLIVDKKTGRAAFADADSGIASVRFLDTGADTGEGHFEDEETFVFLVEQETFESFQDKLTGHNAGYPVAGFEVEASGDSLTVVASFEALVPNIRKVSTHARDEAVEERVLRLQHEAARSLGDAPMEKITRKARDDLKRIRDQEHAEYLEQERRNLARRRTRAKNL